MIIVVLIFRWESVFFCSVAAPAQQTNGVHVIVFWLGVWVNERFREAAQEQTKRAPMFFLFWLGGRGVPTAPPA